MPNTRGKQALRAALFEMLGERPLAKITVTDLTARARVSRTTYYRLFYSLEDIVRDYLDEFFTRIDELMPRSPGVSGRPLEFAIYQMLQCYEREAPMLQRLLSSTAGYLLEERIRQQVEVSLKWDNTVEKRRQNLFITAGMTAVTCDWVRRGCTDPLEDVLDFMIQSNEVRHHA